MSVGETSVTAFAAFAVAALIVLGSFAYSRARPISATSQTSTPMQFDYLMKLLTEERAARAALEVQVNDLTHKVEQLRAEKTREVEKLQRENTTLNAQLAVLMSLLSQQRGKVSLTTAQPLPANEDEAFRAWLIDHFTAGELELLAVDCDLEPPIGASLQEMAGALVGRARRVGASPLLAAKALERRPGIDRWGTGGNGK